MRILFLSIIFVAFKSINVTAEVLPAEIKNTYVVFTEDARRLSPLPGMIYVLGGILENSLELFQISAAKRVVSENLFHRINAATFKQTISKTVFGGHASLINLGKLAFMLHYLDTSGKRYSDIRSTVETMVYTDADFLASYQDGDSGKKYSDRFKKVIRRFLENLVASSKEDNHNETYKLLTSVVNFLAKDKAKLHEYFVGLAQGRDFFCGATKSVHDVPRGCAPIFINEDFLTSGKETWLKDNFSLNDIQANYDDIKDYEFAAYVMLIQMQGSWVAPFFTVQEWAVLPSEVTFPDCGEVSILNFARMLFGVEETKRIDLDLMREVANLKEQVERFFFTKLTKGDQVLDFSSLYDLRTKEARDAWAEVTANLECGCPSKNLLYLHKEAQDQFEIAPGFSNINRFVQELFGFDIPTLTQRVAEKRNTPIVIESTVNERTDLGALRFETTDRGNFYWTFEEKHFDFYALSTGDISRETTNYIFARAQELGYPYVELISLIPHTLVTKKMERIVSPKLPVEFRTYIKMKDDKDILSYAGEIARAIFVNDDAIIAATDEIFQESIRTFATQLTGLFMRADTPETKKNILHKMMYLELMSKFKRAKEFSARADMVFKAFIRLLNLEKLKGQALEAFVNVVLLLQSSYKAIIGKKGGERFVQFLSELPSTIYRAPVIGPEKDSLLHYFVRKKQPLTLMVMAKTLSREEVLTTRNADEKNPLDLARDLNLKAEEDALLKAQD